MDFTTPMKYQRLFRLQDLGQSEQFANHSSGRQCVFDLNCNGKDIQKMDRIIRFSIFRRKIFFNFWPKNCSWMPKE